MDNTQSILYVGFFDDFRVTPIDEHIGLIQPGAGDARNLRRSDSHENYRALHSHDHRPRRSRARSDLRFRHHGLLSPSNGAAAGSRSTPRAWRWRWPAPASWAHAIRFTCWPIPAKASSRKPKSPAPRRSSQPVHGNIRHGFVYERVPHITLKSIANNAEIDVIWEKWQATLEPLRETAERRAQEDSGRSGRFRAKPTPSGRTRRRNCTPTGGRRASPGRRRSTPPSPPRPSSNTSTTSPTRTRRRSASPVHSPSRACHRTACWAWTRTTN